MGDASPAVADFIDRWSAAEMAERTNAQPFLIELCAVLGVEVPPPAKGGLGGYRFERSVTHREGDERETTRRIDLYKHGCFILEAKQGANVRPQADLLDGLSETARRQTVRHSRGWAQHMLSARGQAEGYVRDLPADEPAPPFLIVCDVGFCFDIYADFSGTGRHYVQFPDRAGFRVYLSALADADIRERLRTIWTAPLLLDPARRRTEVTREIAEYLARLVLALEARHAAESVALFLMRCIFCMFAQSVGLLPEGDTFTGILTRCQSEPAKFVGLVGELWRMMNTGGFSAAAEAVVRRFNGGLYGKGAGSAEPLSVTADEITLLRIAAGRDWTNVDPAIFGTLLENALTVRQRGQLGAHFTPRAFVERLVLPTVMAPLRALWDGAVAASYARLEADDREGAATELRAFHAKLCAIRVLDPACGTGNFLYVTMELMKRLEGEVLDALANLQAGEGDRLALAGASVDPHQFVGLEKNPRAVPVAELVLWIGYLQWHFRTMGTAPPAEPILRDFHNIVHADALLSYDREDYVREGGQLVKRWDGHSMRTHPVTGARVPDETHRVELTRLVGARMTAWPEADFIVGNPPFIAGKDMRAELGDGYAAALWGTYRRVPDSADIAMFFWWRAAQALVAPKARTRRFGFITSNSIRQVFCRRVIAEAMRGKRRVGLVFAISDHPWSDGAGSAAVRIAMTVAERVGRGGVLDGLLLRVIEERASGDGVPVVTLAEQRGVLNADLTIGVDLDQVQGLRANEGISSRGMSLHGAGFIVTPMLARGLGLGTVAGLERHVRPYLNGRDLTQRSRGVMVIDLYGLSDSEVRARFPDLFEHVLLRVKPERDNNSRATYKDNWWIYGEPRSELRKALKALPRYIATVETAKHRPFCFLPAAVIPDNMLVCIASDDAFHLGVLSSRLHVAWALAAGGTLEDRPRYNKTRCFDPFPFPAATTGQRAGIGALAEELDALRRTRLDGDATLTMTGLYNVLERVRSGAVLTAAERAIHDAGQVSVLLHLHERLDEAVAAAYGWPSALSAGEIVARVVALNLARRAEEAEGRVAWLRPAFQAPVEPVRGGQTALAVEEGVAGGLPAWPGREPDRFVALRAALAVAPGEPVELAKRFVRAPRGRVGEMLETLVALGQARRREDGRFSV